MNTKEVSKKTGKCFSYCSRWAKKHKLERVLIKGIWAYNWTLEDVEKLGYKAGVKENERL